MDKNKMSDIIIKNVFAAAIFCFIFASVSIAQESEPAKISDDLSLIGKTFTIEEDDEEIKFEFKENGVVFISGSLSGDRVEGSYTQDEEDVIIKVGGEKIFALFDGEEFELEEPEYFPPGYDITSVGIDAYEARVYVGSESDTIQYRLFIPEDYNEDTKYPLVLFHHGAGGTGNDNISNLEGPCPREWAGTERQADNPSFIIAPHKYRPVKKEVLKDVLEQTL